jgi:hypothetical protein
LLVTHPFHALSGKRLRVLFVRRRWCGEGVEYVCELENARRIALRQEWTDRGLEPGEARVSVETLTRLRVVLDALVAGRGDQGGGCAEKSRS